MQNRTLYFGDNLDILRDKFPDQTDASGYFDLIYLDPPFNSNRDYNVMFKEGTVDSQAQVQAFEDSWHWTTDAQRTFEQLVGVRPSKTKINEQVSNLMLALEKLVGHNDVLAYLTMMTVRLIELHRVLKNTGSIYLHCDPTASHYLKIVLDAVFGKQNFVNELVWRYEGPQAPSRVKFATKHDVILRYAKSIKECKAVELYYFEKIPAAEATFKKDKDGKYFYTLPKGDYTDESIKKLENEGRIYRSSRGTVRIKYFVEKTLDGYFLRKKKIPDVWDDIPSLGLIAQSKEVLGYPTQKPEALLERIIKASSKEDDWILDPFCGCGTTVSVAEKLDRKWVGIDITALAINLIKHRLKKQFSDKVMQIRIDGLPKDLVGAKSLFRKDPFEFEYWALDLVNAMPAQSKSKSNMRGADKGVDGIVTFIRDLKGGKPSYGKLLVQVKGGNIQRSDIATLKGDVDREKAEGGLFLTLEEPTRPMREEAINAGSFGVSFNGFNKEEYPKIQIITIKELLLGLRPTLPPLGSETYYKEAKKVKIEDSKHQKKLL